MNIRTVLVVLLCSWVCLEVAVFPHSVASANTPFEREEASDEINLRGQISRTKDRIKKINKAIEAKEKGLTYDDEIIKWANDLVQKYNIEVAAAEEAIAHCKNLKSLHATFSEDLQFVTDDVIELCNEETSILTIDILDASERIISLRDDQARAQNTLDGTGRYIETLHKLLAAAEARLERLEAQQRRK